MRTSIFTETQHPGSISATVAETGSVLHKPSPMKTSLQRLQQNKKIEKVAATKKQTDREISNKTPRLEARKVSQNGEVADDSQQPMG